MIWDTFEIITWIVSAVGLVLAAGILYVEGIDWLYEEIEEMEVIEDIIANRSGGPLSMYDLAADQAWRRH